MMDERIDDSGFVRGETPGLAAGRWPGWQALCRRWWQRAMRRWQTSWRPVALHLHRPPGMQGDDVTAALMAFGHWCEAHEGAVCVLGLSSRWLLLDALPLTAASHAGTHTVRDTVVQRWGRYHDVDEADFAQRWVYREAQPGGASLACAAPLDLIRGLQAHATRRGVRLVAVQPWWAGAVQAWMAMAVPAAEPGLPWRLQLHEPGLVTHVDLAEGADGMPAWQAVWVSPDAASGTAERRGAVWHLDPFVHAQPVAAAQTSEALLWALPEAFSGRDAWQEAA